LLSICISADKCAKFLVSRSKIFVRLSRFFWRMVFVHRVILHVLPWTGVHVRLCDSKLQEVRCVARRQDVPRAVVHVGTSLHVVGKRAYKNHGLFKDHYFLSGTLPRSFFPFPSPHHNCRDDAICRFCDLLHFSLQSQSRNNVIDI